MLALVLTKSGKNGAICLAVYDYQNNKLLRLVSNRNGNGIPYHIADRFNKFDIISFEIIEYVPFEHQTENVLIDLDSIQKVIFSTKEKNKVINKFINIKCNENNKVFSNFSYNLNDISNINHSLETIVVKHLALCLIKNSVGDLKTKANFIYNGHKYKYFAVTDFDYDLRKDSSSELYIGDACLIISLPLKAAVNDSYYKIVASIIEPTKKR